MALRLFLFGGLLTAIITGCTAITDFDKPAQKIDLAAEIGQTIAVTLNGETGTITMNFDSALPNEHAEEIYDMIGADITLTVTRALDSVGVTLTTKPVISTPTEPGQYSVSVSSDNKTVDIVFYNQSLEGGAFKAGELYRVVLEIRDNDFFKTAIFSADVVVQ